MASLHYWAFLSYSSKDAAFVKKLHAKLETYRMPRDLVGRPGLDEPIPKKLFPVFRDRDELPLASDLGSTIQDALKASRYLIVVCSPNSARSQWVNEEIRYFKSIGRANRILAVIVAGEPHASQDPNSSLEECFPQALRFHVDADGTITDQPTEPIAGDLRPGKDGWDMAFLKCIAGITGCGLNALTAREKKRARRRKLLMAAAGLVMAAGLTSWWDYTRTKTYYYAEIAERFGVPEGHYALSADQVNHRGVSYKIESSRRKVRTITSVHSSGAPVDNGDFESAIQELKFGEDGNLQEIVYRNPSRRITARRIFSELKDNTRIIEFKSEHDDSPMALSAKDISMSSKASAASRTDVTAQRATYYDDGALKEIRFLSSWREPRADPDGVFGMRYEYSDSRLPSKITNLDAMGQAVKNRRGFALVRFRRTEMGTSQQVALFDEQEKPVMEPELYHCFRYEYDRYGNRIAKYFYDEAMQPTEAALGFHKMVITRSAVGDNEKTTYFDRSMQPVMSTDGYHEIQETYDAQGRTISERFFDTSLQPATDNKQVHEIRSTYDPMGNLIARDYFDVMRKPCRGGDYLVHSESFSCDENGLLLKISFYNEDLKPMVPPGHVAHRVEFQHDTAGRISAWMNFDVKGQPIPGSVDESVVRIRYDQRGNMIEYANFDASGKAFDVAGFQKITHEYNDRGLRVKTSYWAVDGKPANGLQGIHRTETIYDERGHKSGERYFTADEKPTMDVIGVHRYVYRKDARGNILEERFFDTSDQPMAAGNGVYLRRFAYNDAGQAIRTEYYDQDSKPMLSVHGFQSFTSSFDGRGNMLEIAYFGTQGEAVRHKTELAHGLVYAYDARNREVGISYLDEKRQPMMGSDGWHERRYEMDLRGNITATRYFGTDKKPMKGKNGAHLVRVRFDDKDRVIERRFFDVEEEPILNKDGWHRISILFRDASDRNHSFYVGSNGKEVQSSRDQLLEKLASRENFSLRQVSYFGVADEALVDSDGVHCFVYEVRNGNDIAGTYFDKNGSPYYIGNYCRWEKSYNGQNEMTEIRWYDEDGEPASNARGIFRQSKRVLPNTRITEYANFDGEGQPIKDADGVHRWQQTTDEKDRITELRYLDPNGHPAKEANGVHHVKNTYDERDNIVRKDFFHANGKPALIPAGHAGYIVEFDENNRETSHTWLGDDGKPVALHDLVARWTSHYDEKGNEMERRFYDAALQPVLGTGGHHIRRSRYDEAGNESERSFFGIADEPVVIDYGLHRWTARYNKRDQIIEKSFFDANLKPISHPEGNHRFVNTYDESGNRIRTEYFGIADEPVLWEKQYHRIERTYNDNGGETSVSYFGVKGEPVESDDGYHKMETTYDDLGRPSMIKVSDREDKQPKKLDFRIMKVSYYLVLPIVEKKTFYDSDDKLLYERKFDMRGNPIDE